MKIKFPFFGKSQHIVCTTKQVYDEKSDTTLDKVLGNSSGSDDDNNQPTSRLGIFINGYTPYEARWLDAVENDNANNELSAFYSASFWFAELMKDILLSDYHYNSNDVPAAEGPLGKIGIEWYINGGIDIEIAYKDDTSFNVTIKTKDWTFENIIFTLEEPSNHESAVSVDKGWYNEYTTRGNFIEGYVYSPIATALDYTFLKYFDNSEGSEEPMWQNNYVYDMLNALIGLHDNNIEVPYKV
jgi:hypothetical protein